MKIQNMHKTVKAVVQHILDIVSKSDLWELKEGDGLLFDKYKKELMLLRDAIVLSDYERLGEGKSQTEYITTKHMFNGNDIYYAIKRKYRGKSSIDLIKDLKLIKVDDKKFHDLVCHETIGQDIYFAMYLTMKAKIKLIRENFEEYTSSYVAEFFGTNQRYILDIYKGNREPCIRY